MKDVGGIVDIVYMRCIHTKSNYSYFSNSLRTSAEFRNSVISRLKSNTNCD